VEFTHAPGAGPAGRYLGLLRAGWGCLMSGGWLIPARFLGRTAPWLAGRLGEARTSMLERTFARVMESGDVWSLGGV
jgi:hypothetical protein